MQGKKAMTKEEYNRDKRSKSSDPLRLFKML